MGESQLGEDLSDAEADKIVAFLNSLSGQMPQVIYPILPAETAATPRPTGEVK
jgi:cytochrome c peroxidase